jgi:hypothetical protein
VRLYVQQHNLVVQQDAVKLRKRSESNSGGATGGCREDAGDGRDRSPWNACRSSRTARCITGTTGRGDCRNFRSGRRRSGEIRNCRHPPQPSPPLSHLRWGLTRKRALSAPAGHAGGPHHDRIRPAGLHLRPRWPELARMGSMGCHRKSYARDNRAGRASICVPGPAKPRQREPGLPSCLVGPLHQTALSSSFPQPQQSRALCGLFLPKRAYSDDSQVSGIQMRLGPARQAGHSQRRTKIFRTFSERL